MTQTNKFLYCIFMTALTMIVGGYFTDTGVESWYQTLEKPILTPPDSVFPIVWTAIYLIMAIAFFMAFRASKTKDDNNRTNTFFINQLFLHILWCFTFFYTGYIALALAILIILNIVIFRSIYWFFKISPISGWLLIPYQGWILFATWLNAAFVYLYGYAINF